MFNEGFVAFIFISISLVFGIVLGGNLGYAMKESEATGKIQDNYVKCLESKEPDCLVFKEKMMDLLIKQKGND